jgi:hypothetical protein
MYQAQLRQSGSCPKMLVESEEAWRRLDQLELDIAVEGISSGRYIAARMPVS